MKVLLESNTQLISQLLSSNRSNKVLWVRNPAFDQQLYLDHTYNSIWGRSTADLINHPEHFINTIHPEDREQLSIAITKRNTRALSGSTLFFRVLKPDGEIEYIRDIAFYLQNSYGALSSVVGYGERLNENEWLHASAALQYQNEIDGILQQSQQATTTTTQKQHIYHARVNGKIVALTTKESECIRHMIEGKTAKETARAMHISNRTVEIHLENVRNKAECKTKYAIIDKLITED